MRIAILSLLAASALAAPALAAGWHSYGAYDATAPIEGGPAGNDHVARLTSILLPDRFRARERGPRVIFGPVGKCRATGVIAPVLVHSTATRASVVLRAQVPGGSTYGAGRRGDAVYRLAKYRSNRLRGAYVRPTRIAGTWFVVRIRTDRRGRCPGVRDVLGIPLADALGTVRGSGY
jgi:hypothetical protein